MASRPWSRPLGRPALFTVAVFGAIGIVACGDSDGGGDGGGRAGAADGPAAADVAIENFRYLPAELTVEAGTSITFTNQDGQAHTATADASDGFDSGSIAAGEPATVEVAEPGRYPYHCSFHPFMTATVIVE